MSKSDPSRWAGLTPRVFCGNLPYNVVVNISHEQSEELLAEAFRSVGPVVNVRLVSDRETGKMKGFGFVEFPDPETASSAVRNMNGYVLEGRELRVDHAEPEKNSRNKNNRGGPAAGTRFPPPPQQQQQQPPPPHMGMPPQPPHMMPHPPPQAAPPFPQGVQLPAGTNATDAISQTLAAMPPDQLLDIMSQMKTLVMNSPEQARNLLNAHPQLAYALFQAMVLMKVVDTGVLQRMLSTSMGQQPPPSQTIPPQMRGPPQVPTPPPQQPYYAHPPPQQSQPPPPQSMPAPPPQPAPATTPAQPPPTQQSQAALLQQVMALTPAQIDGLPPKDRDTVLQLRAQLQSMGR